MDHDYVLQKIIPHRLGAVSALTVALKYRLLWDSQKPMEIYFDGKLSIEGNSNAFLNPVIESGLIHSRALLEFLGLREKNGSLENFNLSHKRNKDDIGIESFSNLGVSLPLVTPSMAISQYCGDCLEAQSALLAIFHTTNKGLAHHARSFDISKADASLIEIASRGIPALVVRHVYEPLGIPTPSFDIGSRDRN